MIFIDERNVNVDDLISRNFCSALEKKVKTSILNNHMNFRDYENAFNDRLLIVSEKLEGYILCFNKTMP